MERIRESVVLVRDLDGPAAKLLARIDPEVVITPTTEGLRLDFYSAARAWYFVEKSNKGLEHDSWW